MVVTSFEVSVIFRFLGLKERSMRGESRADARRKVRPHFRRATEGISEVGSHDLNWLSIGGWAAIFRTIGDPSGDFLERVECGHRSRRFGESGATIKAIQSGADSRLARCTRGLPAESGVRWSARGTGRDSISRVESQIFDGGGEQVEVQPYLSVLHDGEYIDVSE